VLVLADDSAEARFVAADLLAQAEHGSGDERVWLVTPSGRLLDAVESEIAGNCRSCRAANSLPARCGTRAGFIQVRSLDEGVALVNQLAPEHCEIMTRNAARLSRRIVTAGAVFLGAFSPTVLGDYLAGPSHTLPTGGAGVSFSGLTVDQFQRRTSVVEYTAASLKKSLKTVQQFAPTRRTGCSWPLGRHSSGGQMKLADSARNSVVRRRTRSHWPSRSALGHR